MMQFLIEGTGWGGAFLIVVAYLLISTNRSTAQSASYQFLNAIGSAALIVNAFAHQAWPLLTLDAIWGLIAIVSLIKIITKKPPSL